MPIVNPWEGSQRGTQQLGQVARMDMQNQQDQRQDLYNQQMLGMKPKQFDADIQDRLAEQKRNQVKQGAGNILAMHDMGMDVREFNRRARALSKMSGVAIPQMKDKKEMDAYIAKIRPTLMWMSGREEDTSFADASALQKQKDKAAMERKKLEVRAKKEADKKDTRTNSQKEFDRYKKNNPEYAGDLVEFQGMMAEAKKSKDPMQMFLSLAGKDLRVLSNTKSLGDVAVEYYKSANALEAAMDGGKKTRTPQEIRADFKSGKITREEAKKELSELDGWE